MAAYRHTQKAPMWLILVAFVPAFLAGALGFKSLVPALVMLSLAAVFVLLALCFRNLTVEDAGEHLLLRYGPLPLFQKRFAYADMADPAPARTQFIDGWGIHWVPGRGWTYNLWGYDCVELRYRNQPLRIGTDDPRNLAKFLQARTAGPVDRTAPVRR